MTITRANGKRPDLTAASATQKMLHTATHVAVAERTHGGIRIQNERRCDCLPPFAFRGSGCSDLAQQADQFAANLFACTQFAL